MSDARNCSRIRAIYFKQLFVTWIYTYHSQSFFLPTLHKKWSFPLRISSVNVTKSGFGHIYRSNPWWKTSFFVQCNVCVTYVTSNCKKVYSIYKRTGRQVHSNQLYKKINFKERIRVKSVLGIFLSRIMHNDI